jgi:drug/metabolite transporter (DMT)-like permease
MNDDHATSLLNPKILIPFLAVTLIWGTTWIVIRDQLGVVPASWSVTYRFMLGGLVMLAVARISGASLKLNRTGLGFVALFGVAQFVFNFNFVYRAEQHITSGLVATVFALLFVPNALFSRLFLGQRTSGQFWMGSAIAIGGLSLLFLNEIQGDDASRTQTLTGIGFTLMGVLSASTANVMQASERARAMPMPTMLGWGMVCGASLDALFAWTTSGPPVFDMRPGYIFGLSYLAIMASALAFSLYFGTVRQIGPAKAAYSSVIIPIIAMLISTFAEDYRWTTLAAGGAALAMVGAIIALSAPKPST